MQLPAFPSHSLSRVCPSRERFRRLPARPDTRARRALSASRDPRRLTKRRPRRARSSSHSTSTTTSATSFCVSVFESAAVMFCRRPSAPGEASPPRGACFAPERVRTAMPPSPAMTARPRSRAWVGGTSGGARPGRSRPSSAEWRPSLHRGAHGFREGAHVLGVSAHTALPLARARVNGTSASGPKARHASSSSSPNPWLDAKSNASRCESVKTTNPASAPSDSACSRQVSATSLGVAASESAAVTACRRAMSSARRAASTSARRRSSCSRARPA